MSKPTGDKCYEKAILQLRWLIIDEISVVSARLLADVDAKLRNYRRAVGPFLKGATQMHALLRVLICCAVATFGSCLRQTAACWARFLVNLYKPVDNMFQHRLLLIGKFTMERNPYRYVRSDRTTAM